MSSRLRRVLHRDIDLNAHSRYAVGQACRCTVCTVDAGQPLSVVRQTVATDGVCPVLPFGAAVRCEPQRSASPPFGVGGGYDAADAREPVETVPVPGWVILLR